MTATLTDRAEFAEASLAWLAERVRSQPIIEARELAENGLPSADTDERVRAWTELGVLFAKRPSDGVPCCRADAVLAAIAQVANPTSVVAPVTLHRRGSKAVH